MVCVKPIAQRRCFGPWATQTRQTQTFISVQRSVNAPLFYRQWRTIIPGEFCRPSRRCAIARIADPHWIVWVGSLGGKHRSDCTNVAASRQGPTPMSDNQKDKSSPTDKESKGRFAVAMASSSSLGTSVYHIPAADTPEGKERIRAYYEALGRFVDMFAVVETAVTLTLWTYAKTKSEIAKIILAGVRIDQGCNFIKQLATASDSSAENRADLECVFQQLGIITGVRNDTLHFGAQSVAEGRAIVTNSLKAKGEPTVFPISPDMLNDMTADLRKIVVHLNHKHLGRPMPLLGTLERDALASVFQSPWRYKHPVAPKPESKKPEFRQHHKRGQGRPRPPPSSRG